MTNFSLALELIPLALLETIYMVGASLFFSLLLGLPTGLALFWTSSRGKTKRTLFIYKILSLIVNTGRSFPFAIFMIALIPLTKWIVGTSLGTTATIVPLSLAAAPFFARLVESALKELDPALTEAVSLMGASSSTLIFKVLLPEAMPSLIRGLTLTAINLIGCSAMAGLIGGGGLGQIALQYGYQRFNTFILGASVLFLLLLVELIQRAGNKAAGHLLKKRGQQNHA